FRLTKQRRVVFESLMNGKGHPTATEVFMQVQEDMPTISLATVYNCLETLAQCGLVKQVNMDREPSRFCANLKEHAHFHCQSCHEVVDVDFDRPDIDRLFQLPGGSQLDRVDVTIKGTCKSCAAAEAAQARK
ncbi:MAG: transcriptional repressor, partial [Verrucomicrobiota bacterium]